METRLFCILNILCFSISVHIYTCIYSIFGFFNVCDHSTKCKFFRILQSCLYIFYHLLTLQCLTNSRKRAFHRMFIEWVNESTKSIFSNVFEWHPNTVCFQTHIHTIWTKVLWSISYWCCILIPPFQFSFLPNSLKKILVMTNKVNVTAYQWITICSFKNSFLKKYYQFQKSIVYLRFH